MQKLQVLFQYDISGVCALSTDAAYSCGDKNIAGGQKPPAMFFNCYPTPMSCAI